MADSMLVRFDDDLAKRLRDRARHEDKSMTGLINDAVRMYLEKMDKVEAYEDAARTEERRRIAYFANCVADANHAVRERSNIWDALTAVLNCIELGPVTAAETLDPVTLEEYKYWRLNQTGGDEEAQRLFAKEYADIASRDWTWYLNTCKSENEAKSVWLRQRRRFGLPLPPIESEDDQPDTDTSLAGRPKKKP